MSAKDDSSVYLTIDGARVEATAGQSVATAMLGAGIDRFTRSVKYHRPRGPFCFAGQCGSCLVRIDGSPSQKSCMTAAAPGMVVERQNAFPSVDYDVLAAADLLFPRGMDHHTIGTASKLGGAVVQHVVRQVAGLGRLPDASQAKTPEELAAPHVVEADVAIVGGGPAGLAAAGALGSSGLRVLLIDDRPELGGSLQTDARGSEQRDRMADALGATMVMHGASAIAYYSEDRATPDTEPGLLAVASAQRLWKVVAQRYIYATGSYEQNLLFGNNDRPGIVAARGLLRLVYQEGFRPRGRLLVVGDYSHGTTQALVAAGLDAVRLPPDAELSKARGRRFSQIEFQSGGQKRIERGDWLVIAARPAPATELLRQQGCVVGWDDGRGGLFVVTDSEGRTDRPRVFACGDVCGVQSTDLSIVAGKRTALAALRSLA